MFQQKPIPKNAKKVYEWYNTNIRNREQELFDWTFATFETIQRREFSQIIPITPDNKIIILEEEQPRVWSFYWLIGWTKEDGDTAEDTIHKEAREETGMKIHTMRKLYTTPHHGILWCSHCYITNDFSFPYPTTREPGEKIKTKEISFDKFLEYIVSDKRRPIEFTYWIMKNYLIKNDKAWLYKLLFESK